MRRLDDAVAAVDGHGFAVTPFARRPSLQRRARASRRPAASGSRTRPATSPGSHKARHFRPAGALEVGGAARAHRRRRRGGRRWPIAAAGTRRCAAAVVAAAGGRHCGCSCPPTPTRWSLARLEELGARRRGLPREPGVPGDPTYHRLLRGAREGAIPFTCQGNLNGLAIEGGETLGYEMVVAPASARRPARGAGGRGRAGERVRPGASRGASSSDASPRCRASTPCRPRARAPLQRAFDASSRAETRPGALPLSRAHAPLASSCGRGRRSRRASRTGSSTTRPTTGWPWSRAMLATGGRPLVVDEETLARGERARAARRPGSTSTPRARPGWPGCSRCARRPRSRDDERVAVLFTGVVRAAPTERRRAR